MFARYTAPLGALLLSLVGGVPAASAVTCTWNGSAGSWATASSWSCNAIPGASDDVIIGSGTVTLSTAATIHAFTMTGGTLNGAGDLAIMDAFVWEAGTMAGSGTTTVNGAATLRAATTKNVARRIVLMSTTWSGGTLQMNDGGVLINEGVFIDNTTTTHSIARAGAATTDPLVVNRGAWRVESAGTNTNVDFTNEGSLLIAGAGFAVKSPARFSSFATGALIGTALLDLSSGAVVSMSGTTQPGGGAVGTFPIRGPFSMVSGHTLDVDLTGPSANDYDRLLVENGTVTVAGRLRVRVGSESVAGGTYPILSRTGSGSLSGCYGPDDIDVVESDGYTAAPYVITASCTADGVSISVQMATAGEDDPHLSASRLVVTGANPFASQTALALTVPAMSVVSVEAYDALGRRVAVLFEGVVAAGDAVPVPFDASSLPAGLYVVRASVGALALTQSLTVAR